MNQRSLFLQEPHHCSDNAEQYLFPPNKAATLGAISIRAIKTWHIDIGDGGVLIPVSFCPFCGEQLNIETE